ncbi:hypothetical protein ACLOJK_023583 [Asimina triloba]
MQKRNERENENDEISYRVKKWKDEKHDGARDWRVKLRAERSWIGEKKPLARQSELEQQTGVQLAAGLQEARGINPGREYRDCPSPRTGLMLVGTPLFKYRIKQSRRTKGFVR